LGLREDEISKRLRVLHNNLYCSVNIVMKAKFMKLRCIGDVARVGREIIHSYSYVGVQACWKTLNSEDEYGLGVNVSTELKVVGCGVGRRRVAASCQMVDLALLLLNLQILLLSVSTAGSEICR
jgi:hypothetical protein